MAVHVKARMVGDVYCVGVLAVALVWVGQWIGKVQNPFFACMVVGLGSMCWGVAAGHALIQHHGGAV